MNWIDGLIFAIYVAGMIAVAIYTSKKSKSLNDFLFAGKNGVGGWISAFAYGTTYFSAVIFIGYAGKFGWSFGIASIWIGLGNAIIGSLLAWKVLAKRTKNMTYSLQARTMPEFFEKRYESHGLKAYASILIFVFLVPYASSVYNGLSNLFETVFGIKGWIIIIILAAMTALYLFFGGYFATAITDFIQGIIMLIGVVVMLILFITRSEVNGIEGLTKLANEGFGLFIKDAPHEHWLFGKNMSLIALVLLTSFGVWALPQTIHKYYAVRDQKSINQGMVISMLFALIIGFIAYFIGGLSRLFLSDLGQVGNITDNIIPFMIKKVIPVGVTGLIAVLILSASMSTLASVSLASASVLAIDLYKGVLRKDAKESRVTWVMRIWCIIFILISTIIAVLNIKFKLTAIAYLMGLSWGVLSGSFMGPYVLGIYNKKITKTAVWVSMLLTLSLTFILIIVFGYMIGNFEISFAKAIQNGMSASPLIGVICMVVSVLSTVIISLFTKKPSDECINKAFSSVENGII